MNVTTIVKVFRISIALVIICCTLAMFGCNRRSDNAGKYLDEKNAQDFTELKTDGTFFVHQGTLNINGKYTIDKKQIKLSLSTGEVLVGSIEGKTIIDNEGKHWTKQ